MLGIGAQEIIHRRLFADVAYANGSDLELLALLRHQVLAVDYL
ncbi:DUF4127 family protein [Paenibacillus tianmuensis]|nr:DUF4127 family protein [Paenibacillus tianmuensis]